MGPPRWREVSLFAPDMPTRNDREWMGRAPRAARAFTLIELMVVVVLIGIMTAMIVPEMRGTFDDALLRSTARQLVDTFTVAYSRAVTLSQIHRVNIDSSTGRFRIESRAVEEGRLRGFLPVRDLPGGEGQLDRRISVTVREPSEMPAEELEPSAGPKSGEATEDSKTERSMIVFNPDGTADAAEVVLRDREGFQLALRINPATGRVRIMELERSER